MQKPADRDERGREALGFSRGIKTLLLAEIEALWTYLYFNDMEKMLDCSLKALRLFDRGRSSIVTKSADFFLSAARSCCFPTSGEKEIVSHDAVHRE